jgi:hypothetical protein
VNLTNLDHTGGSVPDLPCWSCVASSAAARRIPTSGAG